MRTLTRPGLVMAGAALLYLRWVLADRLIANRRWERTAAPRLPSSAPAVDNVVRIVQFYASPGHLVEGERAILCYGVENARSVRIEPRIDELTPSPNRCLEIAPRRDTRYTLTAEGADGRQASESFLIQVKPVPAPAPQILYFEDRGVRPSDPIPAHSLCFQAANATLATFEPPVVPPTGNRITRFCAGVSESQATCGIDSTSRLLSAYQGRT